MKRTRGWLLLFAMVMASASGCGPEKKQTISTGNNPNNPNGGSNTGADGCTPLGSTKREACTDGSAGETLRVCSGEGWNIVNSTCENGGGGGGGGNTCADKVVFTRDIKPIIEEKCVSCHITPSPYNQFETAKSLATEMARRVNLATANNLRMPPSPRPELPGAQKALFSKWVADGTLNTEADCGSGAAVVPLDLDYIETAILDNLNKIEASDRVNSRFLVLADKYNAKAEPAAMERFIFGMNKGINSLSREDDLLNAAPIDSRGTVYRIDLRTYGLRGADWQAIENVEPIDFNSNTTKGQQIKSLTGSQKAWMHADNFTFASHGGYSAATYYDILDIPLNQQTFLNNEGVNIAQDIEDGDAIYAGGFGSPISINKNRIISRFNSRDGYMWVTHDPRELGQGVALGARNFFNFPLPPEAEGQATFEFDAGEFIFTLPNGLQAYALYAANGVRADFAPLDIVRDNETPFDPTIRNAFSCSRCHASGILTMQDQIRPHIEANGAQFIQNDVDKLIGARSGQGLYKGQVSLNANFIADSRVFTNSLTALGIPSDNVDPQNELMDSLRKDYTALDLASLLFLTEAEFKRRLNNSAAGKAAIGQLLSTNGSVGFVQVQDILPQLKQDFRIGLDDLGQ